MYYDFIEIGTANFNTLIEQCSDTQRGLSIEPVKYYLDSLVNKPLVTKVNCAISPSNQYGFIDVYYIPEQLINEHNLAWWLKGCNSVGQYHRFHTEFNLQHLVKIEKVEIYPIAYILEKYQVQQIDFLKIDTEGHDLGILLCLHEYLKNKERSYLPNKIRFETSSTDPNKNKEVVDLYIKLGYRLDYTDIDDTQLILENT